MPDRVAYDAGPVKSRPTGVGVYVRELASALTPLLGHDLRLIGARRNGPMAKNATTLMRGTRHLEWIVRHADRDATFAGGRLAHYTNAIAPPRSSMPFVVTIQDLSLIRYPHYHPKLRLAVVPFMAWAAHRATRVLTPSAATANEVHRWLRVPHRRLEVIELAPGPLSSIPRAVSDQRLAALGLEHRGFLLSLATLEPRKNIANIILAFEKVAERDESLKLALVGASGWHPRRIERTLAKSTAVGRIVRLGYVDETTRTILLNACAAFVYVSLYEGYGLPVVEAMAAGVPVVTSNVSSMPEAAGGAAVLVDPRLPSAIADGIHAALESRMDLVDAGLRRVRLLSWERVARETSQVYETVANRWV